MKKADEKVQKPKKEKGGKGGKGEHKQKEVHDESQNLRKAPILLKDGDMIGWGLASELQGDDLQTDEDAALRITLKNQPGKFKAGKEKGFVLGVGF